MTTDEIAFWWAGEAIGLSLSRATDAPSEYMVRWGADGPLGVTLGVDAASRAVIVTRSSRADVDVGDVLLRTCGLEVSAATVDLAVATLASAHETSGDAYVTLVFAHAPAPLVVSGVDSQGPLARAGVSGDLTFELLAVGGHTVRHLAMGQLERLLYESPRPCELRFGKRSTGSRAASRRTSDAERLSSVASGAGLAIASVLMVNMA